MCEGRGEERRGEREQWGSRRKKEQYKRGGGIGGEWEG
jgi:hypothetical protein